VNRTLPAALAAVALAGIAAPAGAYPLDAFDETGIARLEAYRRIQEAEMPGLHLPPGARLPGDAIRLRLVGRPELRLPDPDPDFTEAVKTLLPARADAYGVAVLDLSDPEAPRYAVHRADRIQNPGSVGKVLVALAWFQALADAHPEDVEARARLLRETRVEADDWIRRDHHVVPFWEPGAPRLARRPIREGDAGNLYTWLDWMLSASSNAAAAILQKELLLLSRFGADYPVPREAAERYLEETPQDVLGRRFRAAMTEPIERNGLDPGKLRQGSFFTRTGQARVPGTSSVATARELLRFVVQMEKGRLVDPWSSLEIKRLLYLTDRRIRYAASRALWDFPVFFKSGSFYSCRPEPGFECGRHRGNRFNYMNSVAVVEGGEAQPDLWYAAAVLSNVLRRDSAEIHETLGERIHRLVAPAPAETGEAGASAEPEEGADAAPATGPEGQPPAPETGDGGAE